MGQIGRGVPPPSSYEPVFQDPGTEAEALVVRRSDSYGPGGHPVYADESGIVQAEDSDRGEVRMVATGAHRTTQSASACLSR
jgi:hypothetical protein